MLEVFYADHEGSVEAMVESLRTYLGGGAVMTIPKNVREIIVDLEGDILEAGSLATILHERLSERHAISNDDDISDGWFQVACHLVKAIRRTNAAWEKLFEATVSSTLAA